MMRNKQLLARALLLVIYCISIAHAFDQLDNASEDTDDTTIPTDNNNINEDDNDKPATTATTPYHGPAPINSQQKVDNIGHNPSMPKTTKIFKPTLSPTRPNGYNNNKVGDNDSADNNSNTNQQGNNNSPSSPVNSSNEKQIPKKHTDMQYLIKRKAYEKERRYYVDPLAQVITDITTTSKELQSAIENKEDEATIQELKAKHDKANERLDFYQYNDDILNKHQLIEQKEADIRWEIEKLEEKQGGKYYNDIDTLIKVRRKQRKDRDEMYRKRIDDIIATGNYRKGPHDDLPKKMKQHREKHAQKLKQQQPTSQPTSSSTNNEKAPTQKNNQQYYTYEQTYNTIFQPKLEEYDLLKFDPYSLSGAPIGGWGRATRSRLASLPIRLVSDFENGDGFDLWYGGNDDDVKGEDAKDEEEKQETTNEEKGKETEGSESSAEQQTSKKKTPPKDIKQSIGPHFTIHDGAGQKYICRVYAEDELIVLSRLDSVFHPAITIWDTDSEYNNIDDEEEQAKMEKMAAANDLLNGMNNQGNDGGVIKKKFQFSINGNSAGGVGGGGDNTEDLPEGIRSSVAKMLRKMGMNDAAEALANQQANGGGGNGLDVEVDVIVADMTGGEGGDILNNIAGGGDDNMNLADIIKAAAVGATAVNKKPSSSQLNNEQIYQILQSLKGICSQLHTGWWSYEWCHQEQIRQFHVAVSNKDPAQTQYEIQDVTLVGKYGGEMQIIWPKGMYNGKFMKGTTTTVQYDNKGVLLKTTIKRHNSQDDRLYSSHFALDTMDKKKGQHKSNTMTENRGPIISQVFEGGDFCEEVGYNRRVQVDLLCCTESEIDNWLESKKSTKEKRQQRNQVKEPIPQEVLVSVKEEDTCIYRSRVCTPLLCPGSDTSKVVSSTKPDIKKTSATQPTQATDPIGTLLNAIFDDEMVENGEVQVFFPDDIVGGEFDELVALAENGGDIMNSPLFQRVKEALQKGNIGNKQLIKDLLSDDTVGGNTVVTSTSSGNTRAAGVMEVKKGESIREILDKVLNKRPCLMKNLGWWTYEFCHTKKIRQYHANNVIDSSTGMAKQRIETEHILGVYKDSGNTIEDYPNEKEYLHVVNATGSNAADMAIGKRKKPRAQNHANKKGQQPGGNGAVYEQEYKHGELCDHEDVAESVIKGGNILEGSVERSSTVRFSCGDRWEMIDIKEDSTCHYILDVTVPELCQHPLFQAPVTKTQVVKCLPVEETAR